MGNIIKGIAQLSGNVFVYAALNEQVFEQQMSDYGKSERKTTFFSDLSIAEWVEGIKGVKDTYTNVMRNWMSNLDYILEFALSLNWKCWQHFHDGNHEIGREYSTLWEKARDAIYEHYKGDETATAKIWEYFD